MKKIEDCPKCGCDHDQARSGTIEEYNYFAICPIEAEPVLYKRETVFHREDDDEESVLDDGLIDLD